MPKIDKKYLIGGPGRNGKTTLMKVLFSERGPIAGLPVEGLFPTYVLRKYPAKRLQRNIILREYLEQKRYTNVRRTEFARPIDYLRSELTTIVSQCPKKVRHQMELIDYALDVFASDHDAVGWCVHDLHAEYLFAELKRWIPELRLVIMLRDPREAICDHLYYRFYPKRNPRSEALIEFGTMMWIYSAEAYLHWKRLYPEDVSLLSFNRLVLGDKHECSSMAKLLNVEEGSYRELFEGRRPFFSYENGEFVSPDGCLKSLMTREEIGFIEHFTSRYVDQFGWSNLEFNSPRVETIERIEKFIKVRDKALSIMTGSPRKAREFIYRNMDHMKNGRTATEMKLLAFKHEFIRILLNLGLLMRGFRSLGTEGHDTTEAGVPYDAL